MRRVLSALLRCAAAACGGERPEVRRSAILVTFDTTTPGALDVYGKSRGLTPTVTALAADSVVYERARTVAPLTLPAHASMLTGLYPHRHTVHENGLSPVPPAAETLAERARAAGYATAAFLSAAVLAAPYGLDQGFDVYDCPGGTTGSVGGYMLERSARETTRAAQEWLARRDPARPFFLWVHYFDPHAPYLPEPAFLERAGGRPYLGEVAAADQALGDLLGFARTLVDLDDMLVVVAADHGESHGQHGEPTHALLCYDSTLHVPLLVRYPGAARGGTRSLETVSVVDVFPTLLEGMGLPVPRTIDGRALAGGDVPAQRGVYFESWNGYLNYGFSPLVGWYADGQKYLHSVRPELYEVLVDPQELRDRAAARPDAVAALRQALAGALAAAPVATAGAEPLDPDLLAQIQALGYAGAGDAGADLPDPLAACELPAPQARVSEMLATTEAIVVAAVDAASATERLRALVAENPRNVSAVGMLGGLLLEQQRYEDAIDVLTGLLARGHDRYLTHDHLGHAYESLDRDAEALRHYRRALALLPGDPVSSRNVARVEARLRE
jgi:arylsulfatase A-like enzyme